MAEKSGFSLERLALQPVPQSDRQHWISVALIQAGFMISATSLWTGSIMIAGMSLAETLIAAVIGYLIVVLICTVQGMMGSDLGVPSIVAATSSFGDRGSQFLISSVCCVCCVGWFAINANICGFAFSGLLEDAFGIVIPVAASTILWGLIMVLTAVVGFNGLKLLNAVAVPAMTAVAIVGLFMVVTQTAMEDIQTYIPIGEDMDMLTGIDIVIGGFIVGAVLAADFTRYQKTRLDVVKSSFLGIFPLGAGMLLAGALFTIASGVDELYDISEIFIGIGIPVLGLIGLILSTWPANAGNAYSAGLDAVKVFLFDDARRPVVTLICGLIGTVVGSFDAIFYFEEFLIWLCVIIAPFAGVMIADYWIIGKGKPENWAPTRNINWTGMVALLLGVVVSFTLTFGIIGINGPIVAMAAYLLLHKIMPKPERMAA